MITSTQITNFDDTQIFPYPLPAVQPTGSHAITVMIFCNTATPNAADETENAVTMDLYVIPVGLTVGDAHAITKRLVIPAGETIFFDTERLVLDEGDFVVAKLVTIDGVGSITATVSTLSV
jgi:hypothetical protein